MFTLKPGETKPSDAELKQHIASWDGFTPHGIGMSDADRVGVDTYFPALKESNGWRGTMLLKPGFEVVKSEISADDFESEIDAVLAGL